jgi:hypothetical protein
LAPKTLAFEVVKESGHEEGHDIMVVMRNVVFLLLFCLAALCTPALADDMTRLQIHVTNERGTPIDRASVIVKFVSGRDIHTLAIKKAVKSWELKTSQEGMAKIPPIPKGKILIQINAKYYQTFGETYDIDEDERTVEIHLKAPQPQYSVHEHEDEKKK